MDGPRDVTAQVREAGRQLKHGAELCFLAAGAPQQLATQHAHRFATHEYTCQTANEAVVLMAHAVRADAVAAATTAVHAVQATLLQTAPSVWVGRLALLVAPHDGAALLERATAGTGVAAPDPVLVALAAQLNRISGTPLAVICVAGDQERVRGNVTLPGLSRATLADTTSPQGSQWRTVVLEAGARALLNEARAALNGKEPTCIVLAASTEQCGSAQVTFGAV